MAMRLRGSVSASAARDGYILTVFRALASMDAILLISTGFLELYLAW